MDSYMGVAGVLHQLTQQRCFNPLFVLFGVINRVVEEHHEIQ